jgi:hypothetical protein
MCIRRVLTDNQLTGLVPASWGSLHYVARMDLDGNAGLCGPVPAPLAAAVGCSRAPPNGTQLCHACSWTAQGEIAQAAAGVRHD